MQPLNVNIPEPARYLDEDSLAVLRWQDDGDPCFPEQPLDGRSDRSAGATQPPVNLLCIDPEENDHVQGRRRGGLIDLLEADSWTKPPTTDPTPLGPNMETRRQDGNAGLPSPQGPPANPPDPNRMPLPPCEHASLKCL